MKTLLAALGLSLIASAAFAGEGNGNPFPFRAPPLAVTQYGAPAYVPLASVTQSPQAVPAMTATPRQAPRG